MARLPALTRPLRALFRAAGAELLTTERDARIILSEYVTLAGDFFPDSREQKIRQRGSGPHGARGARGRVLGPMDLRLTPRMLLEAYRLGTFPMAESREGRVLYWFDPVARGIMPLDGFHLSRSLARHIRDMPWHVTLNTDFEAVIDGCADRHNTWINAEINDLFTALHRMGHAHALEVRDGDDLIGGIYGLAIGGAFLR